MCLDEREDEPELVVKAIRDALAAARK